MKFRTPYSKPVRVSRVFDPSLGRVRSEFKKECDIKHIVDKYLRTGSASSPSVKPEFGDFTSSLDFHAAQNVLLDASTSFNSLDSALRDRFRNDPAEFLDFVNDESNFDEMVELGIIDRPDPSPSPVQVTIVSPADGGSQTPEAADSSD